MTNPLHPVAKLSFKMDHLSTTSSDTFKWLKIRETSNPETIRTYSTMATIPVSPTTPQTSPSTRLINWRAQWATSNTSSLVQDWTAEEFFTFCHSIACSDGKPGFWGFEVISTQREIHCSLVLVDLFSKPRYFSKKSPTFEFL